MGKKEDREKEIKHLMWLKSEAIKQKKKELQQLKMQLQYLRGEMNLDKGGKNGRTKN